LYYYSKKNQRPETHEKFIASFVEKLRQGLTFKNLCLIPVDDEEEGLPTLLVFLKQSNRYRPEKVLDLFHSKGKLAFFFKKKRNYFRLMI
jgi:hypothetical protein